MRSFLITMSLLCFLSANAGLKTEKPKEEVGKGRVEVLKPSPEFKAALDGKKLDDVSTFWANAGMKVDNKLVDLIKKTDEATISSKKETMNNLTGLHVTAQAAVNVGDGISNSGKLLNSTATNLATNGLKMILTDKNGTVNEALLKEVTDLLKLTEADLKSEEISAARIKSIEEKLNGRKIKDLLECL